MTEPTPTPEDRARNIKRTDHDARIQIADAIRAAEDAAVQRERSRCAYWTAQISDLPRGIRSDAALRFIKTGAQP